MSGKPLIAVPAYRLPPGRVTKWEQGAVAAPERYIEALQQAGARAALLASLEESDIADVLARFDGVMLIGGGDIDSFLYDTEPHADIYGVNTERDRFEIALAREAGSRGMPVLAICRGIQIVNVAFGGTLHQHLPDLGITDHGDPQEDYVDATVTVAEGSRLASACGATRLATKCSHHQAVDAIGEGLEAVAWSDDGIVEGLELRDHPWFVAVQWHPEVTAAGDPRQAALFEAFTERARG